MEPAPVVLFAYNRPDLLEQTLEYLSKNVLIEDTVIYAFSDGPKNEQDVARVNEVREILKNINFAKKNKVVCREKNMGLANNIIAGVTEIFDKYEKIIVLEDDLITASNFLTFMNDALEYYKNEKHIFSITGYSHPVKSKYKSGEDVFYLKRAGSWGWATWKDRWDDLDWEIKDFNHFKKSGKEVEEFNKGGEDFTPMLKAQMSGYINSWAIRFNYNMYKTGSLCVYPVESKVLHIGNTNESTHVKKTDKYDTELDSTNTKTNFSGNIKHNYEIMDEINEMMKPSPVRTIINYFRYDFLK